MTNISKSYSAKSIRKRQFLVLSLSRKLDNFMRYFLRPSGGSSCNIPKIRQHIINRKGTVSQPHHLTVAIASHQSLLIVFSHLCRPAWTTATQFAMTYHFNTPIIFGIYLKPFLNRSWSCSLLQQQQNWHSCNRKKLSWPKSHNPPTSSDVTVQRAL